MWEWLKTGKRSAVFVLQWHVPLSFCNRCLCVYYGDMFQQWKRSQFCMDSLHPSCVFFQVQNNKQLLSLQKHKLGNGVDSFKPPEVNISLMQHENVGWWRWWWRIGLNLPPPLKKKQHTNEAFLFFYNVLQPPLRINSRWTNEELLLAVQG